jgi:hypothetical protein
MFKLVDQALDGFGEIRHAQSLLFSPQSAKRFLALRQREASARALDMTRMEICSKKVASLGM